MKVTILQPSLIEEYEDYLLTQENSLLYYSSKYKQLLKDLLGCEEEYLLAVDEGRIRGLLPLLYLERHGKRVYNSLPYYGSNGGIVSDSPAAYEALAETYNELAKSDNTISSTVISNPFLSNDLSDLPFSYRDSRIEQFTTLSDSDSQTDKLLSRVDSSAARNVKKAVREGVVVDIDPSQFDWLRDVHQENMRTIGVVPKTERFFALVPEYFRLGHDFNLYVARKEGTVLAALLVFYFNQTVEYFTPAIASQYRSIQPLSMILINAITDAARRGFRRWNWGGTRGGQVGVYRFKRKWAADARDYYYYTYLKDLSVLEWPQTKILTQFPGFFVAPFSALKSQGETV
jgi:hypothetical protein